MTRNLILLKSIIPDAPMDTKVAGLICDDCRDDISIMTVTKDDLHHSPSNLECIMHRHKMKILSDEEKRNGHTNFTLKWIPIIDKRLKEMGVFKAW